MARLCRNDPVLAFVDRTTVIWILAPFVVSYLIGGWQMVLWANFICLFVTYNGTWAVNSIGHSGTQKTSGSHDHSQNKWWVAFLTGEGFHGNHHERAGAANLGWKPWEIALDSGTCVLWLLERIGLVWGVSWHVPNPAH
jgi:stearoyl-CoA desaturase (delta-9 desaturase)